MTLDNFLHQVERELGIRIRLRPQRNDLSSLPPVLHELYSRTDGLELPFLVLYPVDAVSGEGWIEFGMQGYSDRLLAAGDAIAVFDPEGQSEIEPVHSSALELLVDAYEEYVGSDLRTASIRITEIPPAVALAKVVAALKLASPRQTSTELLGKLKKLPFTLRGVNAATAIRTVRKFHEQGIGAHLRIID